MNDIENAQEVSIAHIPVSKKCIVNRLGKGRSCRARMIGMGIRPGAEVSVIGGSHNSPRVVQIGSHQVMVGHEMLSHIYVSHGKA